jgi:hypothetical protein
MNTGLCMNIGVGMDTGPGVNTGLWNMGPRLRGDDSGIFVPVVAMLHCVVPSAAKSAAWRSVTSASMISPSASPSITCGSL